MRKLTDILRDIPVARTVGKFPPEISNMQFDSRQVKKGDLFVAVRGTQTDGHRYIGTAAERGAALIVCEELPELISKETSYLQVKNSAEALGRMAANYYDRPSEQLTLIGVTGTNGKTTTTTLLFDLFSDLGYKCGLLSTVENRIGQKVLPSTHTTPDAVAMNELLRGMVDSGCDYCFMEVSSHAVHQHRITGLHFAGGVFTNITHDHLDYHGTFRAYIEAKRMFFDNLPTSSFALVNADDRNGTVMTQQTTARRLSFALRRPADYKGKILDNSPSGLHLVINEREFFARLIGAFNAYNLLAAYGVAVELGMDETEVLTALSQIRPAAGRFEQVTDTSGRQLSGIVDYAHTPDALEKVIQTANATRPGQARLITVVGCGGDRDRTKRPKMAKVAASGSDQVILTSDNPRTEDPNLILREMEAGIPAELQRRVLTIADRAQAIRTAVRLAQPGDLILVAGKGHETYQEIAGVRHPFDDREELRKAFEELIETESQK